MISMYIYQFGFSLSVRYGVSIWFKLCMEILVSPREISSL